MVTDVIVVAVMIVAGIGAVVQFVVDVVFIVDVM